MIPESLSQSQSRSESVNAEDKSQAGFLCGILKNLRFRDMVNLTLRNMGCIHHYYLLSYNLDSLPATPPKKIGGGDLEMIRPEDLNDLHDQLNLLPADDKRELFSRILFFRNGFKNCYLLREAGSIVYLQWIIYPSENQILLGKYKRRYLPLSKNQVMVENAFTFPAYRGRGFHPFVTAQLLKKAKDEGFTSAVSYIRKDNIVSLNNFLHLKFRIHKIIREYKVFGRAWRAL